MNLKKSLRFFLAAALALCMMQVFSLAADPITVQLDGKNITFTDATPRIVNDRTFLPMRAVFEAMGAEVGFDNGVVTAKRGDTLVTMTVGSTEASVSENGVDTPLTMDVAPFIDPELSRTFVPVRFAAQALGANVGWDDGARTVVIVDTEKLVDSALEGKTFTYMDKLSAFSERYSTGIWNTDMKMKGNVVVKGDAAQSIANGSLSMGLPLTVEANGITQDQDKMQVNEKILADLSILEPLLASDENSADVNKMVQALKTQGVSCSVRGDMSDGKLYMNFDFSALKPVLSDEEIPFDSNTWYLLDMEKIAAMSGMDYTEFLNQIKNIDYRALLSAVVADMPVDDAANAYSSVQLLTQSFVSAMADDKFVKNGDVYTNNLSIDQDGAKINLTIAFTMKGDSITAYNVKVDASEETSQLNFKMELGIDSANKISGNFKFDVADMVSADLAISGGYSKGSTAPVTTPPQGATVVDVFDLLSNVGV